MGYSNKKNQPADNGGKVAADTSSSRRLFRARPLAIAAIVAILAVVTFLVVRRRTGNGEQGTADNEKKVQRQRPAKPTQSSSQVSHKPAAKEPEKPKREIWLGREIVSTKVVTNGTNLIITRVDTEGKIHKEYTSIHKRLFSNPVDITLSILLTTPEGAMMPPLPPLGPRSGDVFAEALKKPIEISEDDTPDDKRIKQLVIAAREEMLEELRNGRTVDEVIEDHCTFVDENNRLRAEAMVQYKDLVAEGDNDAAEQFRIKANEMLVKKGANPIKSLAEIQEERLRNREKNK